MRPMLTLVAVLAFCSTAFAQQTTELVNGEARFTEARQRQLMAEGFLPNGDGSYSKRLSFEESARRFSSARFMGGSASGNTLPRNPNPIPPIAVADPRQASDPTAPAYADEPSVAVARQARPNRSSEYMSSANNSGRPVVGPPGPSGRDGKDGKEGPAGPQGPQGEPGSVTTEQLAQLAAIVIQRMEQNPEKFRGPAGPAGSDAKLPSELFVLQFEGADGTIVRSSPVVLGGVATIPPVRLQLQNEGPDGTISHVDRASPLGDPIAIRLPAPTRE